MMEVIKWNFTSRGYELLKTDPEKAFLEYNLESEITKDEYKANCDRLYNTKVITGHFRIDEENKFGICYECPLMISKDKIKHIKDDLYEGKNNAGGIFYLWKLNFFVVPNEFKDVKKYRSPYISFTNLDEFDLLKERLINYCKVKGCDGLAI